MNVSRTLHKVAFCVTTALGLSQPAIAAVTTASATVAPAAAEVEHIAVKGYRSSLQESALLKKQSDNVTESILADDIAQFP